MVVPLPLQIKLTRNMGSAQCGQVRVPVKIDKAAAPSKGAPVILHFRRMALFDFDQLSQILKFRPSITCRTAAKAVTSGGDQRLRLKAPSRF
jgi:hypothetical protein